MKIVQTCSRLLVFGIMLLSMLLITTVSVAAAETEVYFNPQDVSARFCEAVEVKILLNATAEFQSGQINLTYNPACANVIGWKRNTTNFPLGGREHYAGNDWITFTALDSLAGKYRVGTLTVQCEKEQGCETVLAFAESSKLFDAKGNPVAVDWLTGTFRCSGSTSAATTQTSSGGGSGATNTETEAPTASPASTVTPGMTAAAPASTITPTPTAATPSPTVSAFVSPAPTQSLEAKKEIPSFEVVTAMLGFLVVFVVLYVKSKRGN